jgi:hypothetical protein
VTRDGPVDATRRIGFLLHALTYRHLSLGSENWEPRVRERTEDVLRLLPDADATEKEYRKWRAGDRSFHKRLWAALRDWLRSEAGFQPFLTRISVFRVE